MKSKIKALAVLSLAAMMIFSAGCSGGTNGVATTSQPQTQAATQKQIATTAAPTTKAPATQKPTEPVTVKPTEPVTKKQTEAPAEAPKAAEYTAEELLTKNVPEILEILNFEITVENNGSRSHFGSSTGMPCFYNFEKLPGFVFCPANGVYKDASSFEYDILSGKYINLLFIAVMDDAKLNDDISAYMTYNEISKCTGSYATLPPAGQGLITQDLTAACKNASNASVTYETSDEAIQHMSDDGYDVKYLKQENPRAEYIIAYK
ncbi:hypothetical protein SAMN02910436_00530 [Ruminococcaceae bacterium P7]|nr:hypothetical protein SAMN02910436_00530 [Ruminococcaceae bacterium P7]